MFLQAWFTGQKIFGLPVLGRYGSGGKSCRLAVGGLPVWSHPGRDKVTLSKTPNPQLLLTSWLVPCMAANCRWCVNGWMRGINCTALWIKVLYKCSPFTIYLCGGISIFVCASSKMAICGSLGPFDYITAYFDTLPLSTCAPSPFPVMQWCPIMCHGGPRVCRFSLQPITTPADFTNDHIFNQRRGN